MLRHGVKARKFQYNIPSVKLEWKVGAKTRQAFIWPSTTTALQTPGGE